MKIVVFPFFFIAALSFFADSLFKNLRAILLGKKENRQFQIKDQLLTVLSVAFAQKKLLREPFAGSLHLALFWSFILFLFGLTETFLEGIFPDFSFSSLQWFYIIITGVQDIFGALVILVTCILLYRRFVSRVKRLQAGPRESTDAAFVLCMILFVVISMFGQNSARIALHNYSLAWNEFRPLSWILSSAYIMQPSAKVAALYEVFWWAHVSAVLVFLNYLPYSKHFHILSAVPNVFFARTGEEMFALRPLDLEDETAESFGVSDINQLTWKQLLDSYSCTECGRCTEACPASRTGKKLSPKELMTSARARAREFATAVSERTISEEVKANTLLHNFIGSEELWQCTTCAACVQECPVLIGHLAMVVDLRRHLVLTESEFPPELIPVFKNLETNGTPWAFPPSERAAWTEGLNIRTMAEDAACEYLFWVGCAGAYDSRYKKVSVAFANVMKKAGIDFRILGTEERCNGDLARRLGNEYLAQSLMKENIETLNRYQVKKIVTACPHCFNALKHEYKQFGGNYEVVHHTELIFELLEHGKIALKGEAPNVPITYHDSCYLGRYNDIYSAPREILKKALNQESIEMEWSRSRALCCGAGGGQMFIEDKAGSRINELRATQALATGAKTAATACPFCMSMLRDGISNRPGNEEFSVKDIAEIVWEQTV